MPFHPLPTDDVVVTSQSIRDRPTWIVDNLSDLYISAYGTVELHSCLATYPCAFSICLAQSQQKPEEQDCRKTFY